MSSNFKNYEAKNVIAFPSSNAVDKGSVTAEENISSIITRITNLNFVVNKNDFDISLKNNGKILVNTGQANIMGYHIIAMDDLELENPSGYDSSVTLHVVLTLSFNGSTPGYTGYPEDRYSSHIIANSPISGILYCMGVSVGYMTESDLAKSSRWTLDLGTIQWNNKVISNVVINKDKYFRIDGNHVLIYDPINEIHNLYDIIKNLGNNFIHRRGANAFETTDSGRRSGRLGNVLGPLVWKYYDPNEINNSIPSNIDNFDPTDYGIIIHQESKDSSDIDVRPQSVEYGTEDHKKQSIGLHASKWSLNQETNNPYMNIGKSILEQDVKNGILHVSTVSNDINYPIVLENNTLVKDRLKVITNPENYGSSNSVYNFTVDENGLRYDYLSQGPSTISISSKEESGTTIDIIENNTEDHRFLKTRILTSNNYPYAELLGFVHSNKIYTDYIFMNKMKNIFLNTLYLNPDEGINWFSNVLPSDYTDSFEDISKNGITTKESYINRTSFLFRDEEKAEIGPSKIRSIEYSTKSGKLVLLSNSSNGDDFDYGIVLRNLHSSLQMSEIGEGHIRLSNVYPSIIFNAMNISTPAEITYRKIGNGNTNYELYFSSNGRFEGNFSAKRVYNAVYNDGVEFMEKENYSEEILPGDIVCFTDNGTVTKIKNKKDAKRLAGVVSSNETYGYALGGDGLEDNQKVPVGLFGRVYVNIGNLNVETGDLLAIDDNGKIIITEDDNRYVIGIATMPSKNGKVFIKIK